MNTNDICVFCNIVAGKEEAYVINETDETISILDKYPIAPGHTLVISKQHFPNFLETPDEVSYKLILQCKLVGRALVRAVKADGVRVFTNVGRSSMQVIFHVHFHILPSWEKGYPEDFSGFKNRSLQDKNYYEHVQKLIIRMLNNV